MSFKLNSKINEAVNSYDLTDNIGSSTATFSPEFEDKMDRFIKRKTRNRKILKIAQHSAIAVFIIALIGAWLFLMLLPQNEGISDPLSMTQPEGSDTEHEQPYDDEHEQPHDHSPENIIVITDSDSIVETLPEPSDLLIIRNDEPNLGIDQTSREGINSWEEAQALASFNLKEPTHLPLDGLVLRFITLTEVGENGSFPFVAALYEMPILSNSSQPVGAWHLYYYQYYLDTSGSVEIVNQDLWTTGSIGRGFNTVHMNSEPGVFSLIGDTEVYLYTFFYSVNNDSRTSEFQALHWISNNVLYRIVTPIGYADDIVSFTCDDLLAMAESIIG